MRLLEYRAKELLRCLGIRTPEGVVASEPVEAKRAAAALGGAVVVKAQVPVGGRGKAGGIKFAGSPGEAETAASSILGMRIHGMPVRKVLVERALRGAAEYYCAVALDRSRRCYAVMFSMNGGMDVEEIAARFPGSMRKAWPRTGFGLKPFELRRLTAGATPAMGERSSDAGPALRDLLDRLYRGALQYDALLLEINPLILDEEGKLIAADAKIEIDDNALALPGRQTLDPEGEEEGEGERAHGLPYMKGMSYVKLDGDIGVIGNGAGLVMATLDMIAMHGGRPANFLDIGGGARAEAVQKALKIVEADDRIRCVLVNVFGGITRCDEVARGILLALENRRRSQRPGTRRAEMPVVVRLAGTRAREGMQLLGRSGVEAALSLDEAASRAVQFAAGYECGEVG